MNKKLQELRRNLTAKLKDARTAIDAGNIEEGQKLTTEAEDIKKEIVLEEQMAEKDKLIKKLLQEVKNKPNKYTI